MHMLQLAWATNYRINSIIRNAWFNNEAVVLQWNSIVDRSAMADKSIEYVKGHTATT